MKLFVYGLLKECFALSSVLSRSKKLGNYTTKSKGLVMSGFSYPFVWENKYSEYNIKGELYEVNQSDLKHANFILEIKQGSLSLKEIIELYDELEAKYDLAEKKSGLPEHPDSNKI